MIIIFVLTGLLLLNLTNDEKPYIALKVGFNEDEKNVFIEISNDGSIDAEFEQGNLYRCILVNKESNQSFEWISEEGPFTLAVGESYKKDVSLLELEKGAYKLKVETITNQGTKGVHQSSITITE